MLHRTACSVSYGLAAGGGDMRLVAPGGGTASSKYYAASHAAGRYMKILELRSSVTYGAQLVTYGAPAPGLTETYGEQTIGL